MAVVMVVIAVDLDWDGRRRNIDTMILIVRLRLIIAIGHSNNIRDSMRRSGLMVCMI